LETLRILSDEEAPAPSTLLAAMGPGDLAAAAALRGPDASRLVGAVRGDLDGIALMALAKDRRRRYETVNGLAMDVRRYLDDEPVSARAPGRFYLLGKLVRRHKALFGAAAVALLALVTGLGVASWQYSRERQARHDAEAARANEARLLRQSKARESISLAAMLLAEGKLAEADALLVETPLSTVEPSIEAARVFRSLGDWNAIRQRWRQAADCYVLFLQANRLDKSAAPQGDPLVLISVGPSLVEAGYLAEYERFRDETIERYGKLSHPIEASILLKACMLSPLPGPVLARVRPIGQGVAPVLEPNHPGAMDAYQSAFTAMSLGMLAYREGDFEKAIELGRKCLAYPDANQARAATSQSVMAMAAQRLGRPEMARVELARARAMFAGPFNQDSINPRGQGNGIWQDWAIARVMEREASTLIEGGSGG
jgi:tetratricopeptide (TPR) repeat protein